MELVKKITSRTVGCEKKAGEEFLVYGKVFRAHSEETDKGPFVRFGGMFEAKRGDAEFRSSELICPSVVEGQVYSAFQSAKLVAKVDDQVAVGFAFRFHTVEDKTAATGYVWRADMLHDPFTTDPLEDLRAEISGLIEGPKAKAKTAE